MNCRNDQSQRGCLQLIRGLPHIRKPRMCGARIIKGRPFRSRLWLLCEAVNQTSRKEHPMDSIKYIGLDVHRDTISVAVLDGDGKLVMQSVIATRATTILDFLRGLRGTLHVTFEEGTHSAWLYDLLGRRVAHVVVCDPRKNALLKVGNKSDAIDARKLSELLYLNKLSPVYHGEPGIRTLKELARSYIAMTRDVTRVMS